MAPTDAYRILPVIHCAFYPDRFFYEPPLYKWNIQKLQKCLYDFESVRTLEDGCQDTNKEYEFEV